MKYLADKGNTNRFYTFKNGFKTFSMQEENVGFGLLTMGVKLCYS